MYDFVICAVVARWCKVIERYLKEFVATLATAGFLQADEERVVVQVLTDVKDLLLGGRHLLGDES
jgi:hypothetical protein